MTDLTILDGGMGHELKLRGISDGTFVAGVLANEDSTADNAVESIHREYLAAGCDVITTNSFVAVPRCMMEYGLASDETGANQRASALIRASVDRAREAIAKYKSAAGYGSNQRSRIAGCVPPLTECYFANKVPPSISDLIPEYNVILSTLLGCNVDILLAETLSTTREALSILRSLSSLQQSQVASRISLPPLWISFTIHDDKPTKLRSDEVLETACQTIMEEANSLHLHLESIGVNCSTPSAVSSAVPILAKLVKGTDIRISAYGNCFKTTTSEWISSLEEDGKDIPGEGCRENEIGERRDKLKQDDYDDEGYLIPAAYAKYCALWAKTGASIIGGCCGSRPQHMQKVATQLKHC